MKPGKRRTWRGVPSPSTWPYGTYSRLGLHASASARDVIKAARAVIKPEYRAGGKHGAGRMRRMRHSLYLGMLAHHAQRQRVVAWIR